MLVNLVDVLKYAEAHHCAIGAFNTPTLENLEAVIETAEELNVPVIISHAELHETQAPLEKIGPVMVLKAKLAKVPVCVHLDHGEHVDYIEKALKLGFTSVMFDGSLLPYNQNVELTNKASKIARQYHASVEAEIGILGGREGPGEARIVKPEDRYTDPVLAKKFVDDTDIDALACSFGTAHGIYKIKPQLDFDRIKTIRELTNKPLVMHGGSGVSPEDYTRSISLGIEKINYYSYMAREGVYGAKKALEDPNLTFYLDIACQAKERMKIDCKKAMKVFYKLD